MGTTKRQLCLNQFGKKEAFRSDLPDHPVFTLNTEVQAVVGPEAHEQAEDHFSDLSGAAENVQMLVVVGLKS